MLLMRVVWAAVFFIFTLSQAATAAFPIKVDVGGGNLKSGWIRMPDAGNGNDGVVTVDGITFTASCYLPGDEKWRNFAGGDLGGDYFDCDDGYGDPEGSIILTIANLPAGTYEFTSYHNNAEPSYRCPLNITVSGSDISFATTATDVSVTQNTDDDNIGNGTVEFTKTGTADMEIRFVPTCNTRPDGMAGLNGFILDQASPTVQFYQESSGEVESSSAAHIPVVLSEAVGQTVTVDYAVTGGTATWGQDYLLSAGTLVFDPYDTLKTINIIIIDDGIDEEDETIELTLSNPNGVRLGNITRHVYTIIDPRPDVGFETASSIAGENTGSTIIPVSLSHGSDDTVTVNYAVTGGTASAGVDYVLADGTLVFTPGQTTAGIPVTLIDDSEREGPETIELALSEPNNAKPGAQTTHTLTIDDDELSQTFVNSLGMEFVQVMPGSFTMGAGEGNRIQDVGSLDYDEQPAHTVTISKRFYILKTNVSQAHYEQSGLPGSAADVSWTDANAFAEWLSNLEGRTYRLPTEAQWEYAYETCDQLQDMEVRQWVRDWHGLYPFDSVTDPVGPVKGVLKVIRADGQNRWSLPVNARYQPWQLGEAGPCTFRLVMEEEVPQSPHRLPGPFCQAAVKQSTAPALQGPDPDIPYFTVRFALPIPPDNSEDGIASMLGCDPATVHHNHSPGFEIMPNGDALAVWFSAPGSEYGPDVRFVQARLRYGADQWDMPELFWDMKGMNDESPLLWTDADGTVYLFGGGRIADSERRPFVMATSSDNGATWELKRPYFPIPAVNFTAQPVTNAWRQNSSTIYMVTDGDSSNSIVWRSTDNGLTWYDMGGRTNGRHSTIVPIGNSGELLSYGGKNSDIDGWMPWNRSYDWGASWPEEGPTVFSPLGSNQRPNMIRLADGKLLIVTDAQHRNNYKPPGSTYDYGCLIAISDDNGQNWYIKNLPVTLPHESDLDYGTLGYATVRQAPNGTIHILTTMTHPCLHYELNEAWIYSEAGDIPPETTGGTVQQYSEYYPGGRLKATWSARICPNGRYLLEGTETSYYPDGTKEHEVTYVSGRKTGTETFWGPDGTKLWSWEHDDVNNRSVWTHYWSNGLKRLESHWDTYPVARDLPTRHFSGFVADGDAYQWSLCGQPLYAYHFEAGTYIGETDLPEPQTGIVADITGDCAIDNNDLRRFSEDWLASSTIAPANEPNAAGLVLFYDFNESAGTTVADHSGHGYTGTFFTDVDRNPADISGRMDPGRVGNSFHFSARIATGGIAIPEQMFTEAGISQQISVAVWIRNSHPDETPDSGAFMWEFRQWDGVSTTSGPRVLAVETIDRNGSFVFHDDSADVSVPVNWSAHTEWTHYAFVRDATTLKIYVNGFLQVQGVSSGHALAQPGLLNCGISADRPPGNPIGLHDGFTGNMDDFKVYNYALSDEEVVYLANDGPGIIPLDSPADLVNDGVVDFKDFSVLASQWLESYR